MKAAIAFLLALVMLTSCGIRKQLIRPKDIPAYEQKRARKQQQIEQDEQTMPDTDPDDTGANDAKMAPQTGPNGGAPITPAISPATQ